jgi:hypothetical protein
MEALSPRWTDERVVVQGRGDRNTTLTRAAAGRSKDRFNTL